MCDSIDPTIDAETTRSWIMLLKAKERNGDELWARKCAHYCMIQYSPICTNKRMVEPIWYDLLLKNDLVYSDEDAMENFSSTKRYSANAKAGLFITDRWVSMPDEFQLLRVYAIHRFTFGGDLEQDVARLLYVAKIHFKMMKLIVGLRNPQRDLQTWLCSDKLIEEANAFRGKGNQYFQKGDFAEAIDSYTKGLDLNPYCHLLYSNRALCYLKLNEFNKAFHDGWFSTLCGMGYVKGFHRAIEASCALGNFDVARFVCISGLGSNPGKNNGEPRSTPDTPPNVQVNPAKSSLVEEQNGSNIDLQVKLVEAQSQATYLEGVVADLTDDIDNIRKNAAVEIDKINERAVNAEVASLVHFDAVFISFRHSQLEILELRKEAAIVRLRQKLQLAEAAAENAGDNFAKYNYKSQPCLFGDVCQFVGKAMWGQKKDTCLV
ncbi:hypothetical protein CAPTEDRAFT_216760 [Capitella teleta]|uniref:Uncharacterized protein n=1 Tax=Capitella teleta TaxID=283909 RepID=R7V6H0_CAPTE|nr:hypothetical protein CAPTEDRAFT_216760 [Capitella teleta]|eukprot:ELU11956.1 hypothetical protein CAPTEDRAFT_216760 [Capitella teleta]